MKAAAVNCMLMEAFSTTFAWIVKKIAHKFEEISLIFFFKLLLLIVNAADISDPADVADASYVAKVVDNSDDDCLFQKILLKIIKG